MHSENKMTILSRYCRRTVATVLACLSAMPLAYAGNADLQWLEAPHEPQAVAWARQQTGITASVLSQKAMYPAVLAELDTAMRASTPLADISLLGPRAVRLQRDTEHPHGDLQVALRQADGTPGTWKSVLDIDALRKQEGKPYELHVPAMKDACLAPEYRYCLLSLSPDGTDETELREFDLVKGSFVSAGFRVPVSRLQASWLNREHILIAHNLDGSPRTAAGWPAAVRLWQRGTPLSAAPIVYQARASDAIVMLGSMGEGAGARGIINRAQDYSTFQLLLVDQAGKVAPLALPEKIKPFGLLGTTKNQLIVQLAEAANINGVVEPAETIVSYHIGATLAQAQRARIVYRPANGEFINDTLFGFAATREQVFFVVSSGLTHSLKVAQVQANGWQVHEVLPGQQGVSLAVEGADPVGTSVIVKSQGFLAAPTLSLLQHGKPITVIASEPEAFDAGGMLVETRQARSADGTLIDYYLVRSKQRAGNQATPTLMTGYGAFGITLSPGYLDAVVGGRAMKLWFDRGGALVLPAIRGGGERGEAWHQAAIREKRQRSYDDFIAVAEDLVKTGFTQPSRLGVFGTSNGGLLAATMGTQRPDLFGAVVSDVPLIDMLRFPEMGMGGAWTGEYGDPQDPAMAKVLAAYSPLHNIGDGIHYPPFLVTVATSDSRVGPGHARKLVARLHEVGASAYLYEDAQGGHGVSDPLSRPELMAMRMTFFIDTLMRP